MAEEVQYPEIEKMKAVQAESQAIGEFLENCGYTLCSLERNEFNRQEYFPVRKSIEQVLADYFHIDLRKVEAEKRAILESIQADREKGGQRVS